MPVFRRRVLDGEPVLGCFLTWPSSGVVELAGLAGLELYMQKVAVQGAKAGVEALLGA